MSEGVNVCMQYLQWICIPFRVYSHFAPCSQDRIGSGTTTTLTEIKRLVKMNESSGSRVRMVQWVSFPSHSSRTDLEFRLLSGWISTGSFGVRTGFLHLLKPCTNWWLLTLFVRVNVCIRLRWLFCGGGFKHVHLKPAGYLSYFNVIQQHCLIFDNYYNKKKKHIIKRTSERKKWRGWQLKYCLLFSPTMANPYEF